jgi:DNA-binding CsgD family transcriptional regulator/PAS domain-containing protein
VSITLSGPDLDALDEAQTALLSPLDYRTTDTWRTVASARVARLLGADQGVFTPPRAPHVSVRLTGQRHAIGRGDVDCDARDLSAASQGPCHLYRATRGAMELSVDWAVPGFLDAPRNACDQFPGELIARLQVTDDHDQGRATSELSNAFGERGLTVLRLLLPAFKSGIRTHLAFRELLAGMLERVADGAAVWDRLGVCRFRNSALVDLLEADAERGLLERRLGDVARRMMARPATREVSMREITLVTAVNRYRLQATYATGLSGGEPWVVVLVRSARHLPSAELLRERYSLTPRQSEVAERLAEGQSDSAIACALGISRRTAEHHAEAVRRSLGVHSRAALAAALQQGV